MEYHFPESGSTLFRLATLCISLASAASVLPSPQRNTLWAIGAGLVLTRIVLLAHWTSDVAAGLIVGALTERLIRSFTGYPNSLTRRL